MKKRRSGTIRRWSGLGPQNLQAENISQNIGHLWYGGPLVPHHAKHFRSVSLVIRCRPPLILVTKWPQWLLVKLPWKGTRIIAPIRETSDWRQP
jgi:hypothetical protein